jgi:hypothetical protein
VLSPIGGNAVKLNPSSFWWSLSQYPHCCCISIGVNICVGFDWLGILVPCCQHISHTCL